MKKFFLLTCTLSLLLVLWLIAGCSSETSPTYPNIIYILADDMGYGDVSILNADSKIPTTHIDRIAKEGMIFSDAHTNSSVCTPTRYGILTGRYAWRTHMKNGVLQGHSDHLIDTDRETVASYLKKHGYSTACVGKWHLGMDWTSTDSNSVDKIAGNNVDFSVPVKNGPLDLGFDYYFGISASLNMPPHAFMENRKVLGDLQYLSNNEDLRNNNIQSKTGWWDPDYSQDRVLSEFTRKAVEWVESQFSENKQKPFFLYVPLSAPHAPIVPGMAFIDRSGIGSYGDYCMEVDWTVGQILNLLDKHNLAENTLIIFTADNGCSPRADFEHLQELGHYPSYIYRGLKGSLWDGGHRVPFLVRWPEVINEGTLSDVPICTTDLIATLSEMFDEKLDVHTGEDSFSFLPAFTGKIPGWASKRGIIHHSDAGHFSVRQGKWKLVLHEKGGTRRHNPKDKPLVNPADIQLFDMDKDPGETTNLQHLHPEIVKNMKELLSGYIKNGRSNDGPAVLNDPSKRWRQIEVVEEINAGTTQ